MSAVIAVYCLDGQLLDCAHLERIIASVAHRGPDRVGIWSKGSVGLGHCMLQTTPESLQEKLPVMDPRGNFVLTADARIDNQDELLNAIGFSGSLDKEMTDSQLILAAYEKWGEHCPERLIGDFAFALWDERRRALFCARDHFGVKPFYYYQSDRLFAFASEIKALLCLPEVPRQLNEVRVADYLVDLFDDKAITFYQNIFRLPPGHSLTVSREGIRLRSYWSLAPSRELRLGSDEAYAEAFREVFTEAVRCRLRSAFPVGSTLSGGLDSSSITCVARDLLARDGDRRLQTFSAVFDDVPECDERPFINTVLAQNSLQPHFVRADRLSPLTEWERVLFHEDEIFHTPNLFIHWGLYRAAQQQGVRILLDGIDGDTVVSHGLAYLTELTRTGRFISLAKEIKGVARHFNRSPWKLLRKYAWRDGLRPLTPEPLRRLRRALHGHNQSPPSLPPTINPGFARRIALQERIQSLSGRWSSPARSAREDHYRHITDGLRPFVFEVADKAAAAFSLEPRYPFFDKRLVEFCLALPPNQKLCQGWTRMVLRRAMDGILPIEVQWRGGKTSPAMNFHRGLLGVDRGLVEEMILNDSEAIAEFIDLSALRELYQGYVSGRTGDNGLMVWKAVSLALWLRCTHLRP